MDLKAMDLTQLSVMELQLVGNIDQRFSDGRASAGFRSPADGDGSAHRRRNEQNPRPSAEGKPTDLLIKEDEDVAAAMQRLTEQPEGE